MKGKKFSVIHPEEALERYADMVYRIAFVQMKNKSDAEDVFQEVFLRLVRYADTIESDAHLKNWLIRVTVNCCKKQFDSAWRKKTTGWDQDVHQMGKEDEYQVEYEDNPVLAAVRQLPDSYREVVHLFYYEEYSVKEISQVLEESESAVKTRLSRARGQLKTMLERELT